MYIYLVIGTCVRIFNYRYMYIFSYGYMGTILHRNVELDRYGVPQVRCIIHLHWTGMSDVSVSSFILLFSHKSFKCLFWIKKTLHKSKLVIEPDETRIRYLKFYKEWSPVKQKLQYFLCSAFSHVLFFYIWFIFMWHTGGRF